MYPNFNVNLGPIKLSLIVSLFPSEIIGLPKNKQFKDLVGTNNLNDLTNSISFVYENFKHIDKLPK